MRKGNESSNPRTQKRSGQITSALEREERLVKGLSAKADAWLAQVRRCMVDSGCEMHGWLRLGDAWLAQDLSRSGGLKKDQKFSL